MADDLVSVPPVVDDGAGEPVEAGPFSTIPEEQPFVGYDVTELIETDPSSALFLADDERLGRRVTLRAIVPELDAREDALERFFNEARNVARLRHPNLVRGLDVARGGSFYCFVAEYVRGETLAARLIRLERGRLSEELALQVVRDIAMGLQYVFENGLVHRDVRPGTILLAEEGPARLRDLGFAREVAVATDEEQVRMFPEYASPEQARGDLDIEIRSDLYNLGCVWFHMLIGHPPFRGQTVDDILRQRCETEAPNPRELNVRISAATSELVKWLLQTDRDDRPRTPQAFLARLADHPLAPDEPEPEAMTPEDDEATDDDNADASDNDETDDVDASVEDE